MIEDVAPSPDAEAQARLKRYVDRFMSAVPHLQALGIGFRAMGADWAELEMPYAPQLVAYPETGVIASGAVFSLMDSAAGFSVIVKHGKFEPHATLDLRCDYLRPAQPGKTVIGTGVCSMAGCSALSSQSSGSGRAARGRCTRRCLTSTRSSSSCT